MIPLWFRPNPVKARRRIDAVQRHKLEKDLQDMTDHLKRARDAFDQWAKEAAGKRMTALEVGVWAMLAHLEEKEKVGKLDLFLNRLEARREGKDELFREIEPVVEEEKAAEYARGLAEGEKRERERGKAALRSAQRLALHLWASHYRDVNAWEVADDIGAVVDQIDNMVAGMIAQKPPKNGVQE